MEAVRWCMESGRGNRFCSPWQRTGCWVSEMGSCWKILHRGVKWSDLNFKRILLWESLATILRIDCKRKRVELGRQVSRLVACEMTVELTSEGGWIWDVFQGGTDEICWWGWIWGEKEGSRMTSKVFAPGTWKTWIFVYQDRKTGRSRVEVRGARLVFWGVLRWIYEDIPGEKGY